MMNCKICGVELKKSGELCNNCMNKLLKEQEVRNDKSPYYTFKRKFVLGYELLKHLEQVAIVIFMIVLLLSVSFDYWRYAVIIGCVFAIYGIIYLWYLKYTVNSGKCTLYRRKLVFEYRVIRKKVKEIPFDEIEEIYYTVGNMQKLFNLGTIVIKRKTRNLLQKNLMVESVKDVDKVFEKIREVFR